jgi:hypothetical protein
LIAETFERGVRITGQRSRSGGFAADTYNAAGIQSSGGSSFNVNDVQAGLVVNRNLGGGAQVSARLVAGGGNVATTRSGSWTNPTITSDGTARLRYAGAHLRASHEVTNGPSTIVPFVDLGATKVGIGAL